MNSNDSFLRACKLLGSQRELAARLGVSFQAISQVACDRRPIPAEWCPVIEEATKGEVRCESLRPDVRWGVLRRNTDE